MKKGNRVLVAAGKTLVRYLHVGDTVEFHMTNQPGNPWWPYRVLIIDDDGDVTFTSSSRLDEYSQISAEHVRYTRHELIQAFSNRGVRMARRSPSLEGSPRGRRISPVSAIGLVAVALMVTWGMRR